MQEQEDKNLLVTASLLPFQGSINQRYPAQNEQWSLHDELALLLLGV
jgi:hypothetical protein